MLRFGLRCKSRSLTWRPADVEHVTDDLLGVLVGLPPEHLDGGGRQRLGLHLRGHAGQAVGPEDGQAGAGLRGAGAVLRDALVDGLVVLADAVYGQCAGGGQEGWSEEESQEDENGKKERE